MKNFYPNAIKQSILDVDLEFVKSNNIKLLLLDVDNTMKPHYDKYPSADVTDWLKYMKGADVKVCIVSNGHQERVDVFAAELDVMAIGDAMKPGASGFKRAMEAAGVAVEECCVIGDQIFTDIIGGNRAGMLTVLVPPISKDEPWWVKIKRVFEVPFRKSKKTK